MKLKLILLIILTIVFFSTSYAGKLDDAINDINRGNIEQGFNQLLVLAKSGDAEAQYFTGRFLIDKGKQAEQIEGVIWLEKAVSNQHMDAAQTLSKMYLSGFVVPLDINKGTHYLALANEFRSEDEPEEDCD
ncbi:MAG: hypothetical protein KZQ83_10835 [gamma proteobacterium symbiont of Taylorina sp.]|nr:hypothetical protein [gamma proteobacterium symbiont of Taylorina sp.]